MHQTKTENMDEFLLKINIYDTMFEAHVLPVFLRGHIYGCYHFQGVRIQEVEKRMGWLNDRLTQPFVYVCVYG